MREPAPVHYLRPNHAEWSPPAVIFLDTETRTVTEPGRDVEVLRLWVGYFTDRATPRKSVKRQEWGEGDSAGELADWVGTATRGRGAVWLFAHNLSFDLATTRLPIELVKRGWQVNDAAIGGRAPWLRLGRKGRVLTLVDSASWLNKPLEDIAKELGMAKRPLPGQADERATWAARCRQDVEILAAAMLQLMAWWDRNKLGRWNVSGPACGWNAFRHRPTAERIVIDPEPTVQEADRECLHGGRRGTWSIGDHAAGPFTELDFVAAYPSVARTLPLPIGRAYQFDSLSTESTALGSERWGITARVRLRTDVPRWPLRIGGAKWYPTGEFWTHLAGPDIAEARRLGCLEEIGAGWMHRLGWAMAPWANWVLDVQDGRHPDAPPVARMAAKSWGREVIGKWSSRGYEKIKLGPAPASGWSYEEGWDHGGTVHGGMVDLAGQRWWVAATGLADNAYPAISAWVEAEVRVRLGRAIEALGAGAVLQCDTDGLIVAERVVGTAAARGTLIAPPSVPPAGRLAWCLEQLTPAVAPLVLRAKRRLGHVTVLGPQHVKRDGVRRYAGLPGMAEPIKVCAQCGALPEDHCGCGAELVESGTRFKVKLWPKLQWQLGQGDPRGYVRPERLSTMKGPWPTGWLLTDNTVVPLQTYLDDRGRTRLRDWPSSTYWREGLRAAELQHPRLMAHL